MDIVFSLMTYHRFVTGATRRVPLVDEELSTISDHQGSPQVFCGVRVIRSLVLCVMFCRSLLVLLTFFFGHCVVCPSSIYGFWLPLWYLQILLMLKLNVPQMALLIIQEYYLSEFKMTRYHCICKRQALSPERVRTQYLKF